MSHQPSTLRLVKEIPLRQIAADAVAEHRRKVALVEARETIRCLAVQHGHFLGMWRVEGPRVALVQCWACGEGARLDLDVATTRLTEGLTQQCEGLPRTR